jgi:hypothetical protein
MDSPSSVTGYAYTVRVNRRVAWIKKRRRGVELLSFVPVIAPRKKL